MYDYLLATVESFIRYGLSPTALVVAVVALFKTKKAKRLIARRIPWLFRDESDILQYQDRQKRIEKKLDAIAEHLGVPPCGQYETGTSGVTNSRVSYRSLQAVTFPDNLLRRVKKMKKFKSRKFWMAVVTGALIILNDGLDLGIDSETVLAFAGMMATFIIGESAVDARRAGKENVDAITYNDPGSAE